MTQLENKDVILRALEPEDIDLLFELENDTDLWKYSNRSQPYSKHLLKNYITNAHKHIFEIRQIKFTIIIENNLPVGFVDLFDYEPLHHRAAVGLVVQKESRERGYGTAALQLIDSYAKKHLQLHQLYAHIAVENKASVELFKGEGYVFVGKKKDWNFYDDQFHDEFIYQKII